MPTHGDQRFKPAPYNFKNTIQFIDISTSFETFNSYLLYPVYVLTQLFIEINEIHEIHGSERFQ